MEIIRFFKDAKGLWHVNNTIMPSGKLSMRQITDTVVVMTWLSSIGVNQNNNKFFEGEITNVKREDGTSYATITEFLTECGDFFVDATQLLEARVAELEAIIPSDALAEQIQTPIQDCVGNNYTNASPLVMTANTEYPFVCNGALRNKKYLPPHITNIWNTSLNKATFSTFVNIPEIVSNVQFSFAPSNSQPGNMTVNVYVNESSPILMKSYTVPYKGSAQRYTVVTTFYADSEVGFDVKNKGVIFKITASSGGNLYDTAIEIYKT